MQFINASSRPASDALPKWEDGPVHEDLTALAEAHADVGIPTTDPAARRKWFANEANRSKVELKEDVVLTADFTNGCQSLSIILSLNLRLTAELGG